MLPALKSGVLRSILHGQGAFRAIAVAPIRAGSTGGSAEYIPPKTYTKEERIEQWDYVNSVYFGPERDLKNFPNPSQPDQAPPVRMGIVPASWFEFFYPKTGVTGPYLFAGGLSLWMLSKEVMVIDHYFWEFPSFWGAVWFVNYKFGSQIKKYFSDQLQLKQDIIFTRPINAMKGAAQETIAKCERLIEETEVAKHLYLAKKEGVELQLEAAYRQRLLTAFQEVKKRLDYALEKENVKRRYEQEHMVNWIVSSVTKSITAQQEKESIQSCIKTLKNLSAKQAAVL
ncbi:unnamed protein product [Candidula unifasciata]|uniref:ATP synthase subunit b n=1 Tax=Candidula unifasciata TaxID=100452 RepID=A0A8S3ZJG3_9EUPU|nr:unnamed protein product [Candidula unifasciata]